MVDYAKKLKELTKQVGVLKTEPRKNPKFAVWYNAVERTLKNVFGDEDERVKQFQDISFSLRAYNSRTPSSRFEEVYREGLAQSELLLQDFLSEIPDSQANQSPKSKSTMGSDVFIVHGHDNEAKQETARLIEKLNLNAVILHERPNKGRTVIEKLVGESQSAGYAIIILTPDDIGFIKGKESEVEERARQNVVLELGYFLGKLERERVCILLKGSTSIPSDFSGVLYIKMDSAGKWKYDLANEMKEVGFNINLDNIS